MRKSRILSLILSVMLVFSAAAALTEAETETCAYTVYNATGEKITELYLTDNNTGEKSENFAGEKGLDKQGVIVLGGTYYEGYVVTLSFKTESGYEAAFTTLHYEDVPITLLPAPAEGETDATTGATPISFSVPDFTAVYTLKNLTGEKVTEVTLTENHTGEVLPVEFEAMEPDGTLPLTVVWPADKTGKDSYELTLKFVTESGYEGSFGTLHFETVGINLLAVDALTGPTQISFSF